MKSVGDALDGMHKRLQSNPRASKGDRRPAPTSRKDIFADRMAHAHRKMDEEYYSQPLIEVFHHKCPTCSVPIDLEIRGNDPDIAKESLKYAVMVHCDTCIAFAKILRDMREQASSLVSFVSEGAGACDSLRYKIENEGDPAASGEYEAELRTKISQIEGAWDAYHTMLDSIAEAESKYAAHIENQMSLIPDAADSSDF